MTGAEITEYAFAEFTRWISEQDDDVQELDVAEQAALYMENELADKFTNFENKKLPKAVTVIHPLKKIGADSP